MKYLYQRNNGIITKYTQIEDNIYLDVSTGLNVNKDEVLLLGKVSENIIDLIEEGDYINEEKIIEVRKQDNEIYLMTDYCPQKYIKSKIKSIVTREQFKKVKFEV